ncbi:MAG: hypothetical protein WCI73_08360 [Phycisphaerae bacterium]
MSDSSNLRDLSHAINRSAAHFRPHNRDLLADYLLLYCGLRMPKTALCPHHHTPLDYLAHAFFEEPGDLVVWACRGGGKTQLAAVATLLDLVFKPQTQIRILGGSFEQSTKMYGYLCRLMARPGLAGLLAERPTRKRLTLKNGSGVEVLAQSNNAVRGQRVQKLRCDEVELFNPEIWNAAQLTTRSRGSVRGSVEAISTFHVPGGLMEELVGPAGRGEAGASPIVPRFNSPSDLIGPGGRKVLCWCIWDVIARCEPERPCATCPLAPDCGGKAKGAEGFVEVSDVLNMQARVSRRVWKTEMLCVRPRTDSAVFPGFDPVRHICQDAAGMRAEAVTHWIAGVDFGLRTFVCLWLRVSGEKNPHFHVLREMVTNRQILSRNVAELCVIGRELVAQGVIRPRQSLGLEALVGGVEVVHCDSAGAQQNSQTGTTDIATLEAAGLKVRHRPQLIAEGIGQIERLLTPADNGPPRLTVNPTCSNLIAALERYRRDPKNGEPIKDGIHDHLIDALRYALCGVLGSQAITVVRSY